MNYTLARLDFSTGLHTGAGTGGPSLDATDFTIHSDTLFSALCHMRIDKEIEGFKQRFETGALCVSDALPYLNDTYYLPRPQTDLLKSYDDKALRKLRFWPLRAGAFQPEEPVEFGVETIQTRAAIRPDGTTPYFLAVWRFYSGAGLYVVVRYSSQDDLAAIQEAFKLLGISGVGAKTSSGLGKFETQWLDVPKPLLDMLEDEGAPWQMLLGTALPCDDELESALQDGCYRVIRRGGFIHSGSQLSRQTKKRALAVLAPGSCLKARFEGSVRDVGKTDNHPVWRLTNSLFVGVKEQ